MEPDTATTAAAATADVTWTPLDISTDAVAKKDEILAAYRKEVATISASVSLAFKPVTQVFEFGAEYRSRS